MSQINIIGMGMNAETMSDTQMLEQVTKDIRELRVRMNTYIDDHAARSIKIAEDIAKIREDMAGHKGRIETRVGMISGGVSLVVASIAAWLVKHFGGS